MPSVSQRKFLAEASETYYQSLRDAPDVIAYLTSRGLSGANAQSFRLGVVANPLPGHEKYVGKLAIPYLTRSGVVTIRFRCVSTIEHPEELKCSGHAKYLSLPGDIPRIYNPNAFHIPSNSIAITEGEMDCITATNAGVPAVGLPGVSSFRDYMPRLFAGYQRVFILADSDDKGQGVEFAEKIAERISNTRIIPMPPGHDVNSFVLEQGVDALRSRLE